ncbi:MAG: OB-fold nucleic acid binding domain-containing protein, partial [Armatimonadota bacterium]
DHPLIRAQEKLERCTTVALEDLPAMPDGTKVVIGGLVTRLSPYFTRSGEQMMFVTLQDLVSEAEVTVFPRALAKCEAVLERDSIIVVQGKVQQLEREGADGGVQVATKVVCDSAKRLVDARRPSKRLREAAEQARSEQQPDGVPQPPAAPEPSSEPAPDEVHIHLPATVSRAAVQRLRDILSDHRGAAKVVIHMNGKAIRAGAGFRVDPSPHLADAISRLVGPNAVRYPVPRDASGPA